MPTPRSSCDRHPRWGIAVLACAALLVPTSVPAQERPGDDAILHQRQLANGLAVVVVENHAVPLATVLLAVRGGAEAQAEGEEGMAHLLEHLVFRAYGNRSGAFASALSELHGLVGQGTTDVGSICYYLVLPSENADRGIRLLGDLVRNAKFGSGELDDERAVVLDELARRQSDPEGVLERQVSRLLWGEDWHRRDVGGDSASLESLSPEQVATAYGRLLAPDNAALIVTGDVRPEAVFDAAAREFTDWERGRVSPRNARAIPIEPATQSRVLTISAAVPEVTIRVGLRGPGSASDATGPCATAALVEILGDPGSPFQNRLVGSGLFHAVDVSYSPSRADNPITFVGRAPPATSSDALLELLAQIDSLDVLPGVTEDVLDVARRRREVARALAAEATVALAPVLAAWWSGAGLHAWLEFDDRLDALTLRDLREAGRRYFALRPAVIGILGPDEAVAAIRRSVLAGPDDP